MKKKLLCDATSLQVRQLDKFMTSKKQDACTTTAYKNLWMYFEQVRILQDEPKSFQRQYNERNYPHGFGLTKSDAKNFVSTYGLDDDEEDDGDYECAPPTKRVKRSIAAQVDDAERQLARSMAKYEAQKLTLRIMQVECDTNHYRIYDTCQQLIKKVRRNEKEKRKRKEKDLHHTFFFVYASSIFAYFL